ncbi:MAG: translesion error-prone DNA polymerase V autoproteolytic subunit [Bacteroidetes bacterium]|nr:translesion error-prone DNA polymerase V autoproteolytic subunit [Bacteroidota bacterium]
MDAQTRKRLEIPFADISVPAGFPSPATDYAEERINLNNFLIPHPESTFLVKCSGDSMINAFVPPRCLLLVDRSLTAQNGDMVLAHLQGEFTVKYLQRNDQRCRLVAANRKYPDIDISPEMGLVIWGVVTRIITDPKAL